MPGPGLLPGAMVPPKALVLMFPTVPEPPKVPPALIVTTLCGWAPSTSKTPSFTAVVPG